MISFSLCSLVIATLVLGALGHGRVRNPPSRATQWREEVGGWPSPPDYILCSAYDRYFEKVTKAYVEYCDDSKIEGWLYLVMPDEYDMFVPYVKMGLEYVGKYFYENPRLPGCDAGNGGNGGNDGNVDTEEISCDKFYESQTRCGMKKAWLCDYAKWKCRYGGNFMRQVLRVTN